MTILLCITKFITDPKLSIVYPLQVFNLVNKTLFPQIQTHPSENTLPTLVTKENGINLLLVHDILGVPSQFSKQNSSIT